MPQRPVRFNGELRLPVFVLGAIASLAAPLQAAEAPEVVRVATFNVSLYREAEGALVQDLSAPDNPQATAVAAIIRTVRPDILLVNEFDYDATGAAAALFRARYLEAERAGGPAPIRYPHVYLAPSNTGIPSGADLNRDGRIDGPEDARGFGRFPGQYGMLLLSRFPIDVRRARTFQNFLWRDMPTAALPDLAATETPNDWYSPQALAVLPLSSKSHWDVPVRVGAATIHVLASHPTPPGFDGPEDRNGARNHDEIRLWNDYISRESGKYLYDDRGNRGSFRGEHFVIVGDLNSDPVDGNSRHAAIRQLLAHPRVSRGPTPSSAGALEATRQQGGANVQQRSDARFDTADFNDRSVGNMRVDYALPSRTLRVCRSGVFWPASGEPGHDLLTANGEPTSDHHLVWIDVSISGRC
jgi:hypothetical protein